MHIEYWVCDGCNEKIEDDKKLKYATPEMGYPFIDKKTGKHYHYDCLLAKYKRSKKISNAEMSDLLNDAVERHNKHFKEKLRIGVLNQDTFVKKRGTKKDKDSLISYLYNYYGIKNVSSALEKTLDSLNKGDANGKYPNIQIPYNQLKDMLVYFRTELDKAYKMKVDKGVSMAALNRVYYDIAFVVNNLDRYINKKENAYNQLKNNKIEGENAEKTIDNSKYINYKASAKEQNFDNINELHKLSDELGKVD